MSELILKNAPTMYLGKCAHTALAFQNYLSDKLTEGCKVVSVGDDILFTANKAFNLTRKKKALSQTNFDKFLLSTLDFQYRVNALNYLSEQMLKVLYFNKEQTIDITSNYPLVHEYIKKLRKEQVDDSPHVDYILQDLDILNKHFKRKYHD